MQKTITLIMITLFVSDAIGQSLGTEWYNIFKSTEKNRSRDVAIDADGFIYNTGYFTGDMDADPTDGEMILETEDFGEDGYIIKMRPNGDIMWSKQLKAESFDLVVPYAVEVDDQSHVIVAGFYEGTVDFDPGSGTLNKTAEGFDGFIVKLDVNGDLIWFRAIEGAGDQAVFSMELDNEGSVHLTGYYSNTTDFDPSGNRVEATAKSGDDPFVLKLDRDGLFEWFYAFGADGSFDGGNKIAVGDDGSVGVIGNYEGTIDFPTPSGMKTVEGMGSDDTFMLKLDKDGNYEWSYEVGGESKDYGQAVDIDKNGNLYFGGYTLSDDFVIDANGENVQKSFPEFTRNAFLIKYNADGSFNKLYAHQAESLTDMTLDGEGNLYVCGAFDDEGYIGSPEQDLTPPHLEFDDIYYLKLKEDLEPVESGSIVGLGEDLALDIEISDDNEVYLAGWFKSDIRPNTNDPDEIITTDDFDGDVYVVKLSSMSSSVVNLDIETEKIKIFPNPVDDFLDLSAIDLSINSRVRVYNIQGVTIINQSFNDGILNLSLSPGTYILQLQDGDKLYNGKFVKL